MMGTEIVPEMLVVFNTLTQLTAKTLLIKNYPYHNTTQCKTVICDSDGVTGDWISH
jgi:hypothetical protein